MRRALILVALATLLWFPACGGGSTAAPVSNTLQHSVARQWDDILLEAIRNDFVTATRRHPRIARLETEVPDHDLVATALATP